MRRTSFFAGVAIALAVVPATAAQLSDFDFEIGNWGGSAYTHSETGKFSHCAASAEYKNGNALIFSIDRQLTWAFGIYNENWELTVDDTYPVHYRIDSGRELSGEATAVSPTQVKVPLPGDDSLFNRMRRGSRLTVTLRSQTMKFDLTSTSQMLAKLFNCVIEWRKRLGDQ